MKLIWMVYLALLTSLSLFSGDIQGEKVVLHSFASPKIAPKVPSAPKTTEISVEEESKSSGGYGWLWVPALLLIIVGSLAFVWKGFGSRRETFDESDIIRNDAIITQSEETNSQESKESSIISPKKEVLDHTDIFYRFTQNVFFSDILRELKVACDAQDTQEVVRCMEEIEKYQKNFRRSSVIATMSRLVSKEGFTQLSQLIEKEMK